MNNPTPSVLMTYVHHHDAMASEHWQLFSLLRSFLKDCEAGILSAAIAPVLLSERLSTFLNVLAQHHSTENAMLQVVCPSNMQAHLQEHEDLAHEAATILENFHSLTHSELHAKGATLLESLQQHIATLDQELAHSVNTT